MTDYVLLQSTAIWNPKVLREQREMDDVGESRIPLNQDDFERMMGHV